MATDCRTTRGFSVVSHGWHTGIVIDRSDLLEQIPEFKTDFGAVEYLEVGWGDAGYYQASKAKPTLALRAALFPTSSVLHVVEVPSSPRSYFSKSKVVDLRVPETGYGKMLDFIAGTFYRDPRKHDEVVKKGKGLYGKSRFYRAKGSFHAFNTCNTWVARAVAATGFPVSRRTVTVEGLMGQLDPNRKLENKCYSVR
ncbi:MAG: DUF2459 domain-containing protein [Deltaproteobacteria bacterium]|nr:DUF2459 domain-containing protein [Deltaproteobacteria bacterium]